MPIKKRLHEKVNYRWLNERMKAQKYWKQKYMDTEVDIAVKNYDLAKKNIGSKTFID